MLKSLVQGICLLIFITSSFTANAGKARPPSACLISQYKHGFEEDVGENLLFAGDATPSMSADEPLCGKSTSLLDSFNRQKNFIRLDMGGSQLQLMPLALYRKNKDFKCNRIKVRSACFETTTLANGNIGITLSDKDTPSKGTAEFIVDKSTGRIMGIHPEFALIRGKQKNAVNNKTIFAVAQIDGQLEAFRSRMKTCAGRGLTAGCRSALEAVAENWVLERLRYERFPRQLTQSEINSDWQRFRMAQGHLGEVERAIDEMMTRNEAGKTSPYEISDATVGKSGLSFGVRQLDIGSNKKAKDIFRKDIAPFKSNWVGPEAPAGDFIFGGDILAPVRNFSPDQLYFTHQEAPRLTDALRSPSSMENYEREHQRFLGEQAAVYAGLRKQCGFKDSPNLALFAIDRVNQTGSAQSIEKIVRRGCEDHLPIGDIEAAAISSFGEFADRARNILEISTRHGLK